MSYTISISLSVTTHPQLKPPTPKVQSTFCFLSSVFPVLKLNLPYHVFKSLISFKRRISFLQTVLIFSFGVFTCLQLLLLHLDIDTFWDIVIPGFCPFNNIKLSFFHIEVHRIFLIVHHVFLSSFHLSSVVISVILSRKSSRVFVHTFPFLPS
jgi:hypothetical protein